MPLDALFPFVPICVQIIYILIVIIFVSLDGLGVKFSPQDPRFTDSNPAEVSNFSRRKNPEHKSSERDFKPWVSNLRFQAH